MIMLVGKSLHHLFVEREGIVVRLALHHRSCVFMRLQDSVIVPQRLEEHQISLSQWTELSLVFGERDAQFQIELNFRTPHRAVL